MYPVLFLFLFLLLLFFFIAGVEVATRFCPSIQGASLAFRYSSAVPSCTNPGPRSTVYFSLMSYNVAGIASQADPAIGGEQSVISTLTSAAQRPSRQRAGARSDCCRSSSAALLLVVGTGPVSLPDS